MKPEGAFFQPAFEETYQERQKMHEQFNRIMDLFNYASGLVFAWVGIMIMIFRPALAVYDEISRPVMFGAMLVAIGCLLTLRFRRGP